MRFIAIIALMLTLGCEQRSTPPTSPSTGNARTASTNSGAGVEQAPVPNAQTNSADSNAAFTRPFLWEVTRDEVDHKSYLFGTLHSGIEVSWETLPPTVRAAIESSERVVLEAKVDETSGAKVAGYMMLPPERSLKSAIGEQHFDTLVEMTDLRPEVLDRFRPWLAHSTLVDKWSEDSHPMDDRLLAVAQEHSKELGYLDTVERQLESLDQAIGVGVLVDTIKTADAQKKALRDTVEAYRAGDADRFRQAAFGERWAEEKVIKVLFEERNDRWRPRVAEQMQRASCFVAVGTGHLIGPHNLIEALKADGWTVERSSPNAGR